MKTLKLTPKTAFLVSIICKVEEKIVSKIFLTSYFVEQIRYAVNFSTIEKDYVLIAFKYSSIVRQNPTPRFHVVSDGNVNFDG